MTTWMDDCAPPPYWPGRTCETCEHWQAVSDGCAGNCEKYNDTGSVFAYIDRDEIHEFADVLETARNFSCCLWEPRR